MSKPVKRTAPSIGDFSSQEEYQNYVMQQSKNLAARMLNPSLSSLLSPDDGISENTEVEESVEAEPKAVEEPKKEEKSNEKRKAKAKKDATEVGELGRIIGQMSKETYSIAKDTRVIIDNNVFEVYKMLSHKEGIPVSKLVSAILSDFLQKNSAEIRKKLEINNNPYL